MGSYRWNSASDVLEEQQPAQPTCSPVSPLGSLGPAHRLVGARLPPERADPLLCRPPRSGPGVRGQVPCPATLGRCLLPWWDLPQGHCHVVSQATLRCCPLVPHSPALKARPGTPRAQGRVPGLTGSRLPSFDCCSQDGDLPTLISSLHRSSHLVMPEHQSHCEFQGAGVEIGLGSAGEEPRGAGGQDRVGAGLQQLGLSTAHAVPSQCLLSGSGRRPQHPWQAAREASGGGGGRWRGRLSPGAPCDGNCVNPGQPGRQGAEAVAPRWLLLGWAFTGPRLLSPLLTGAATGWLGVHRLRNAHRGTTRSTPPPGRAQGSPPRGHLRARALFGGHGCREWGQSSFSGGLAAPGVLGRKAGQGMDSTLHPPGTRLVPPGLPVPGKAL